MVHMLKAGTATILFAVLLVTPSVRAGPAAIPPMPDGTYLETKFGYAALIVEGGYLGLFDQKANRPASQSYAYMVNADGRIYARSFPKPTPIAFPGLNCSLWWTGTAIECKESGGAVARYVRIAK